jgi:Holliday junction resolvase RusA-like endonuclease
MGCIEYTFFGNVPSKKNGRRWIQRGKRKYSIPSAAYEAWEKAHKPILKHQFKSPKLTGIAIEVRPFFPDNRMRDTDNLLTSVLDCLKDSEVIKDDRWQYHRSPPVVHQPVVDKLNPRVEIVIHYGFED